MTLTPIPVANPLAQTKALMPQIEAAIMRVLKGGHYILGPEVDAFETEFAAWLGAQHAVGVASGTDAVMLALMALGIQAGDEVILPSHSAVATAAAIAQIGAKPVFTDIDPSSRCLAPAAVEGAITPRTTAIIAVHIFGQPADIRALNRIAKKYHLALIEDCAQAHGATLDGQMVGTFGDAGAFSFYPTKNLGALGDGGAVVCRDTALADKLRQLRQYGWKQRYISDTHGINSRLDEMQAAILRVKLPHLSAWNERRREIAQCYTQALQGTHISPPLQIDGTTHAMHLYVLTTEEREALRNDLHQRGIATALHYPEPIHRQAAYASSTVEALPATDRLYATMLTLPLYPELDEMQIARITEALGAWKSA